MARRRWRVLVLLAAGVIALPGCAQWGSWFSGGKAAPSAPANLAPPATHSQFGAKSGLFGIKALSWPSRPAAPPREEPKSPEEVRASQAAYARLCERRGDGKQAEAVYQAMLQKNPRDPEPHHRLAVLAVQKGDFAEAQERFRTARELGPPSAELLSDLGYTYYLEHRLPEAEATLRQALAKEQRHAAATNNLGLVVGAAGRYEEALTLFRRTSSEAQAYSNLAYVLSQRGELKRAEDVYLYALTLDNTLRPSANAVVQIVQRRQAQEQLAARQAKAEDRPIAAAERPPAPEKTGSLVEITEGRPTAAAQRRPAQEQLAIRQPKSEDRPVAASERPPAPEQTRSLADVAEGRRTRVVDRRAADMTEKTAAGPRVPAAAPSLQRLAARPDPVEPDVAEVEVGEPAARQLERLAAGPAASRAAPEEPPGPVQKTSFESAMAELQEALSKPPADRPAWKTAPSPDDPSSRAQEIGYQP